MFTLGYNKYYNSLYKQNLDSTFGIVFTLGPNESTVIDHVNTVHYVNVSSVDITNNILSYQLQKGLTSDLIIDGKFMKDFTPKPLVIDKLGYGMLEGAAHYYFTETMYLLIVDSTMPYTNLNLGRSFYISPYSNTSFTIGTPVGEVFPNSYLRFHSPAVLHRVEFDVKLSKLNTLTEISPDVYQNNPVEIYYRDINLNWDVDDSKSGLYKLDPDVLPPKGFLNIDEIKSHPTVKSMVSHMGLDDIHSGNWIKPELSSKTTVSSDVIDDMFYSYRRRNTPNSGDWFVSPDKKSYSYEAPLTETEGHWIAISIGDPDAKVTDPDNPNIILGQCVNGTDEMRCYFTLDKDKFPVATPTVLLRRCNPIMGFKALTLADVTS